MNPDMGGNMNNKTIFKWQNGKGDYLDVTGDSVEGDRIHDRPTFNDITIKMNEIEYVIKGCGQCHELFIAENTNDMLSEDDD